MVRSADGSATWLVGPTGLLVIDGGQLDLSTIGTGPSEIIALDPEPR